MRTFRDASFRRALGTFYVPWYRRVLPWVFIGVGLFVVARIAATPFVDRWARRTLVGMDEARGSYRKLDLFTWPPVLVLDNLHVQPREAGPSGGNGATLVIERFEVHTSWKQLLRAGFGGTPTVRVRIARPHLLFEGTGVPVAAAAVSALLPRLPDVHVELLTIEHGEVRVATPPGPADAGRGRRHEALMTGVRARFENFAGPPRPGYAPRGTLTGQASLLGSGHTRFKARLGAGAEGALSGEIKMDELSVGDLYLFLDGWAPRDLAGGSVAFAATFSAGAGHVEGRLRTATAAVAREDLPRALADRLRDRLAAGAPWVSMSLAPAGDESAAPGVLAYDGMIRPAGTGGWLDAVAVARTLFVEGVVAAAESLPHVQTSQVGAEEGTAERAEDQAN